TPWWRAFLTVAAYTGMRRGELCEFRWGDVDRVRGRIRIRQKKTGQTIEVPLHPEVEAALRLVPRSTKSDRVFFLSTIRGERYEKLWGDRVTVKATSIFKRAGLKGSLHALRHTYATLLLGSSGNLMAVKEALGHRQIATTMQYAFLLREGLEEAVKTIPTLDAAGGLKEAPAAQ
ncbi:MAG TPA: site-specific integrase, partial [Planctomycetota bacterium]|nr:site-specific integrase [Planctomycetota bacterium]